MAVQETPLLVVVGLRLHGLRTRLAFLSRWRRFLAALTASAGLLKMEMMPPSPLPWRSRYLILTWWRDRETLRQWDHSPEHEAMEQWAAANEPSIDFWIEKYLPRGHGDYLGAGGGMRDLVAEKGTKR